MRSCRESARASPTGTASAGPGTRPRACGATRPSCCSTPTRRRSAERSRSGRRCSARTTPTPASRAPWTPPAHVPRSLVVDPAFQLAGRQAPLAPVRGHGAVRDPRQGLHHAPPGHPPGAARDLRRAGPRGRDRAPARPGRHHRRTAAGAPERARGVPGRGGPDELLGLQHDRLLRPAQRLFGRRPGRPPGRSGQRVQDDGGRAAPGRPGSDPRRGVQPHRRSRPGRPRAVLPRHRQHWPTTGSIPATPAPTTTPPAAATRSTPAIRSRCS